MAEGVVDVLEPIEVHHQQPDQLVVLVRAGQRRAGAVAQQRAVREPGEVVVPRLMLSDARVAARAVDGEQRQRDQRQQQRLLMAHGEHERRQSEHQRRGHGLEGEVLAQVLADRAP